MRFREWLDHIRDLVVGRLTTSDVRTTLRNYLVAAFAAGLVMGAMVSSVWLGFGLIASLVAGAAMGYAARSYISFRRRESARERRRTLEGRDSARF